MPPTVKSLFCCTANTLGYSGESYLSSTAHQFLRFGKGVLTNFQKYAILTTQMKTQHGVYAV